MARDLEIDTDGLRNAATASENLAADLRIYLPQVTRGSGTQPSQSGVVAVEMAIAEVRARQSRRIAGQADDVVVAAARYDDVDGRTAEAIEVTV